MNPRVDILGVQVSAINLDTAVGSIERWISSGQRQYVCVTGVHGVMESQADRSLMRIHNESGLTTPDGMPLVWCGRLAGAERMSRVYGPDLMLRVLQLSEERGWRHFFYGAGPGVPDRLATNLRATLPKLRVVGTHSPPFRELNEAERSQTVRMLNGSGANIVWVGLSTPKQERWMSTFRPLLDAEVLIGVGAAFDIHAGVVPQAPKWMQQSGLEWAFRLGVEPRRLWRRYLVNNPRFLRQILTNRPRLVDKTVDRSIDEWDATTAQPDVKPHDNPYSR